MKFNPPTDTQRLWWKFRLGKMKAEILAYTEEEARDVFANTCTPPCEDRRNAELIEVLKHDPKYEGYKR